MTDETEGARGEAVDPADLRASHADRDQVVEVLRDAAGDGRLTTEELSERVEAALRATTMGELARLTRDLPVTPLPVVRAAGSPAVVEINQRFGTVQRSGPWVVPRRLDIRMKGGDVKLDFTEAAIEHDALDMDVDVGVGGDLVLVVRPGIVVATGDLVVGHMGEIKNRVAGTTTDAPVELRVTVTGRVRGDVVIRYPRRTLGQWARGESAL
ncbi:DUF1707 domain-containing protein [Streptomyces sp. NPDC050560]|uniref:DUF1707 domain-containing protein n=1 Tax=Streptomyces sp. NPDC050560 TaxID=3365630 RepID=UPI00378BB354